MEIEINTYFIISCIFLALFLFNFLKGKLKRRKYKNKYLTYTEYHNNLKLDNNSSIELKYNDISYNYIMESIYVFENSGNHIISKEDIEEEVCLKIGDGDFIIAANITEYSGIDINLRIDEKKKITLDFQESSPKSFFTLKIISSGGEYINYFIDGKIKKGLILSKENLNTSKDLKEKMNSVKNTALVGVLLLIALVLDGLKNIILCVISLFLFGFFIYTFIPFFKGLKLKK